MKLHEAPESIRTLVLVPMMDAWNKRRGEGERKVR